MEKKTVYVFCVPKEEGTVWRFEAADLQEVERQLEKMNVSDDDFEYSRFFVVAFGEVKELNLKRVFTFNDVDATTRDLI